MTRFIVVLGLGSVAACYTPRDWRGAQCGPDGACPEPLVCAVDNTCQESRGAIIDARPDPGVPDASPDDAAPSGCEDSSDCQFPPSLCLSPGTCDPVSRTCQFAAVDCSSLDGPCTLGVCQEDSGCVAQPANEDSPCGETSCGAYGECSGFVGFCGENGTHSRTCTDRTCRAGVCTEFSRQEDGTCSRGDRDGMTCSPPTETQCSGCVFSHECAEAALPEQCTCNTFTCVDEDCTRSSSSCQRACERDTDGDSCGSLCFCSEATCFCEPPCDPICP
jgi:hypothetical protein